MSYPQIEMSGVLYKVQYTVQYTDVEEEEEEEEDDCTKNIEQFLCG